MFGTRGQGATFNIHFCRDAYMKELLAALSACMKLTAAVGLLFLVGAAGAPVGVWVGMAVLCLALLPTLPRHNQDRNPPKERSA